MWWVRSAGRIAKSPGLTDTAANLSAAFAVGSQIRRVRLIECRQQLPNQGGEKYVDGRQEHDNVSQPAAQFSTLCMALVFKLFADPLP